MYLQLEYDDGTVKGIFGISDFDVRDDGVYIAFYRDVDLDEDEKYRLEEAKVRCAISEAGFNEEGVWETVANTLADDDATVVVGQTHNHPHTGLAANNLLECDDVDTSNLEVVG